MRYFLFLICCFFAISPALEAQQVVTGQITDASDGTPVLGATVFIANTAIGTYSDEFGKYTLTIRGEGVYEIVVSHVSYQSVFHKIETPKPFHQIDVALEANEMQEVTVTARAIYSQRDVDLFWRALLGVKPSNRGLQVLNPEKVYFYRNSDNVLKVSCREPVEIVNHEMGYHIRYVLQSFVHDYRINETTITGKPFFEELVSQNNRQKNRWEKKRKDAYAVSINRFMRALYREQIHEEGFILAKIDAVDRVSFFPLEDIIQSDQEKIQVNIESPLLLACVSEPVTEWMLANILFTF